MAESPIDGALEGAPAATATPPEEPRPAARLPGGPAMMHDRYRILPERPLSDLSSPSASAFAAEDRRDMSRQLFALVCTPGLPPRINAAAALRGSRVRNLLPLVEFGAVDWQPLGQHCMVMIYERPLGGRLVDLIESEGKSVDEHDIQRRVIEPVSNAVQEMANHDEPHRAVRPANIFLMDPSHQTIVLGDCLTAPPGFDQPVVFETIERAMAGPAGRGTGDTGDDMYALGVCLVFLLLGRNPVANLTEEELIYAKVEQGTYATLCGDGRIPLSLLEPLRGLLSDDPEERWGLRELSLWIDGRRMTPIQKRAAKRPETPFPFAGHNHVSERTLAHAMSLNVPDAAIALKERQLDPWVRRSLGNPEIADEISRAVDVAVANNGSQTSGDDLLVSRVGMLLDPQAPIRYKGYAFRSEAFGPMLAVELLRQGNTKIGQEILNRDIVGMWFDARSGVYSVNPALERRFGQLRAFLENSDPGYGMERCLYEMNPSLPCQSELVLEDYVVEIDELLPALDHAANRVDTKISPVDRHIAAFVAARFDQDVENHLKALGDSHESKSVEGMLSLLSIVQWRLGPDALYGLSSWVGGLLGPAINSYHSRTVRRDIEREIPRLVRQGSLTDLFDLIDNAEQRQQDEEGYEAAIDEFVLAETEIQEIEGSDSARTESAERIGQQTAAMTSVIVTLIFVTIILLNDIW
ncbi:MAG: hypothetical protein MI741_12455 [Rhodospirillales bacterium]|nr:hypothetical protein [Rhodospirillales bacterium]